MKDPAHNLQTARTKIVATVGPASNSRQLLSDLTTLGVDVFRINMAHGTLEQHAKTVATIHEVSAALHRPVGILADLSGPKIRLGQLAEDPVHCELGAEFFFIRGKVVTRPMDFVSNYPHLIDELDVGKRVMLADGTVGLVVEEKQPDRLRCRVILPGILRSRQGINLPGVKLSVPSMTQADLEHARWTAQQDVDFVGLSFVRSASDIEQLRDALRQHGSEAWVVAKIEKPEALENLTSIVLAADAVMVARGDLGVEMDVAKMPMAQKQIIKTCNLHARPVIVATQMLDSMQHSNRPTRAEATDVANAILDGADACMLSGETAIGEFPCESVTMMEQIMEFTEQTLEESSYSEPVAPPMIGVHPITSATVLGAGVIAKRLHAKLVVLATLSGRSALAKSTQRDFVPTIAVSDSPSTLRRITLFWGVTPVLGLSSLTNEDLSAFINEWGTRTGCLTRGDRVVVVTGSGIIPSANNQVVVHQVG